MTICFNCGKKKEDYEVWWNKLVIGITFDSEFQNNQTIRSMTDKSMMCHDCIKIIEKSVDKKNNL
ncbi:MAG: hypothetical protein ITD33_06400 [Nitrosarchaeum sp.]|nr:hypothetical protein [Nitrosarchaeum sp.]MBP0120466.1 hypothetical protein [Nitrosarchaeum sp.]MBP0134010.1 hypothetical protein [Nitrosarchaeum sp.]